MTVLPCRATRRPATRSSGLIIFGAIIAAAGSALALWLAWHPPFRTYFDYVPIAGLFGAFVGERLLAWRRQRRLGVVCDAAAITFALMRVFVPPLPFFSGHTLLAVYATLTAERSALRTIAIAVLALVVYDKLFWAGGWRSMLAGALVAGPLATIRNR